MTTTRRRNRVTESGRTMFTIRGQTKTRKGPWGRREGLVFRRFLFLQSRDLKHQPGPQARRRAPAERNRGCGHLTTLARHRSVNESLGKLIGATALDVHTCREDLFVGYIGGAVSSRRLQLKFYHRPHQKLHTEPSALSSVHTQREARRGEAPLVGTRQPLASHGGYLRLGKAAVGAEGPAHASVPSGPC